tara:strand:- start:397 stop:1473 length:1077 start_codon:yes stop_codon:yes gene_type:complete
MYLLFDKVYVKPMYMLDMERPRVIISPDASSELLEGIETKFRNLGEMFYNVDGYNQLVGGEGEFANDKEFFNWLLDKGRVDVFVDSNAYHKIFVKWIKIMYPDISKESANKIYQLAKTNSRLITKTHYHWGADNNGADDQKALADNFKWLSTEEFQGLFKQVQVVKDNALVGRVRAKAPIEIQIAGKLNDKSTYDDSLGTKMFALLDKKIEEELGHIKDHLLHNINKDWVKNFLSVSYTAGDDIFALEGANAKVDFVLGVKDKSAIDVVEFRTAIGQAIGATTGDDDGGIPDSVIAIVQKSKDKISSSDIATIIEKDRQSPLGIFSIEDRIKVNVMLLNFFYNLKNNNSAELANYSIG